MTFRWGQMFSSLCWVWGINGEGAFIDYVLINRMVKEAERSSGSGTKVKSKNERVWTTKELGGGVSRRIEAIEAGD